MMVAVGPLDAAQPTIRASARCEVPVRRLLGSMPQEDGEWELLRQALHEMVDTLARDWKSQIGEQVVWEK
jgi:hypothetical protein